LGIPDTNPTAAASIGWRMPAEWEPHAATWLTWPRPDGISFPGRYDVVPTYRDANDERALGILRDCFPGRSVIGLDSTKLIWGLGSFHCLTQQEPAGE
jgi:agmatine/peptidylarginine deiminase